MRHDPAYLYVPEIRRASTVTVIDQRTHKVVRVIPTGYLSQHVVPAYDLSTLYTNSSVANELVRINPRTGRREGTVPMPRPYNLYFTPDGKTAVVMIEAVRHHPLRRRAHLPHRQGPQVPRLPRPEPCGLLGQRPVLRGDLRVLR